jgi:hypothetical protein
MLAGDGAEERAVMSESDHKKITDDDDVEGHVQGHKPKATEDDDVEGHVQGHKPKATDDDDVEGHVQGHKPKSLDQDDLESEPFHASSMDDDVEGHSLLPNPGLARQLQQSRERDIQQHLKRHEFETDIRRKGR